jgi:phosphotriesterase-related protein
MPNDATRIGYLRGLMDAGFGDRLLVSQDICMKVHLTRYGGESYAHILENVIPMMDRSGFGKEEIRRICVENPARALAFA